MAQYEKTNTFTLGRNKYKEEGDKKPNYTGLLVLEDGTEKEIAAWIQTNSETGEKFFSGRIQDRREKSNAPKAEAFESEDIPF